MASSRIADVAAVGGALRQLLARAEIRETRALIAISDASASFRILRFPMAATNEAIESQVQRDLPASHERIATQWVEVHQDGGVRTVYAIAWDRDLIKRAADAARAAGLEPVVIELKSASVARAVNEPTCVVVDLSANPIDIFVIHDHLPHLWHSFELSAPVAEDVLDEVASPIRQVLRYSARRRDAELKPGSPILIAGEQVVSGRLLLGLSQQLGHPVQPLPAPARVSDDVRHGTYLTCLGLLMRRST